MQAQHWYLLTSLPNMTLLLGELPYLYGKFWTINGYLFVRTYVWKIQLTSLHFMTILLVNLPHLYGKFSNIALVLVVHTYSYGKFSIFPGSSLVRTYFWKFNFILQSFIEFLYLICIHLVIIDIYSCIIYCIIYITQFYWQFISMF